MLKEVLKKHALWVKTDGKEGERAEFMEMKWPLKI